ncbi:MAG TPA: TonB family protein [Chitinophagales bacterium]|nr:TonB family protein [Chitinophagales bacterium]
MKPTPSFLNRRATSSFFLFFFLLNSNTLKAQTEETDDKTLSPYFVVISEHPETDNLPLKETSAKVNIVGVIADVTVKQVYINSGKNTLEAIYTFPLSTKAAVYAMQMTIGSRVVTAKIEEKQKAKKEYEEAKKEGKRTSLLEQSRPNVFTMNVGNIAVNDTITVELKYTELLVPESGQYSFVYPTVVGPRYSNKSKETASTDDNFVSTPYTKEGVMPTYKYGIEVMINSGIPIQNIVCSTHKTIITQPDLNTANVVLDPSESYGGNRDVIVNYSLQGNKIESGVMLYENGDENFFLMMIQPPKKVLKEEIPPREYIFIVDVSGSMHGFPIDISKKLLRNLILNLKPDDKFNVLLFSGYSATLSQTSLNATQENFEKAVKFIDAQGGGGGTELLPAMRVAYSLPRPDPDLSRSFVIVTDGYVDIEKETFEFIRNNSGNTNFFSFGIGNSVNRYLMEGMAFMGGGEPMIVTKPELASEQAEKFRNYINTPVLTHIKTNFGSFQAYDVEPASSPDMLAERPIIIFGKYKGKATGTVTVKGKAGRTTYEQSFDLSKITPLKTNSAIRYLWAREKIKLLDYYSTDGYSGKSDNYEKDITDLGLKYNLMTNYTSFIAVDEQIIADKDGKLVRVQQANPLPEGVSNYAVGYEAGKIQAGHSKVSRKSELKCMKWGGTKGSKNYSPNMVVPDSSGENFTVAEEEIKEDSVFQMVESMPSFPGGGDSLMAFIHKNILYPAASKAKGIFGTVYISFVIEKDGSISEMKVLSGVNDELNAEALRVISMMPNWIPGIQNGNAERVRMTLPVKFVLE